MAYTASTSRLNSLIGFLIATALLLENVRLVHARRFGIGMFGGRGRKASTQKANQRSRIPLVAMQQARFDRFLGDVFDSADTNKDGTMNLDETYELVLKMYIKINREAEVDPPSREKIAELFSNSDLDRNKRISRKEFKILFTALGERAAARVATMKLITILGAPVLAELCVRRLKGEEWLPDLAKSTVPHRWHDKLLPILTSENFWRAAFIVIFVQTLGDFAMNIVNRLLDIYVRATPNVKK